MLDNLGRHFGHFETTMDLPKVFTVQICRMKNRQGHQVLVFFIYGHEETVGAFLSDSIWGMVLSSGLMAKFVLCVLLVFSVVSWAIVGVKLADFRRAKKASTAFLNAFRDGASGQDLYRMGKGLSISPICGLFCAVYERAGGKRRKWFSEQTDLWHMMNAQILGSGEILERHLVMLATVGSVSPFIGLFGTVWGIMDAFRNIGFQGAANLAVVAPGIAEALVATAAGLGAAIPAVMAYNYFVRKIGEFTRSAEQFAADLAVWLKAEVAG